jgi:hypothetical protein
MSQPYPLPPNLNELPLTHVHELLVKIPIAIHLGSKSPYTSTTRLTVGRIREVRGKKQFTLIWIHPIHDHLHLMKLRFSEQKCNVRDHTVKKTYEVTRERALEILYRNVVMGPICPPPNMEIIRSILPRVIGKMGTL